MFNQNLKQQIEKIDAEVMNSTFSSFKLPKYNPKTHYIELTRSGYFYALIALRQNLKMIADHFFVEICGARNVDLFMITPSISSPMGLGSNSEAIAIKFGKFDSYLVDSSQFGFEPLLLNRMDTIYCYLPSIRGEDPDKRHLNQFFNCEAEIKGTVEKLYPLIEDFVKILAEGLTYMPNIVEKLSLNPGVTNTCLKNILHLDAFPEILFDKAVELLVKLGNEGWVRFNESGRDLTSTGEVKLAEAGGFKTPFWIKNFDRDRVPFYQKPNPNNREKVINADMVFPPLIAGSFSGEIVGSGQRQDDADEMLESLKRQNVNPDPYEWYINLRRQDGYQTTSGFGLGVERFITWILCRDDIKDVILYPRIKNVLTYP